MELIRYDAMLSAIRACHEVDEIRAIHGKAGQVAAAARMANDVSAVQMATEIRVRAERRLGQLLKDTTLANGGDAMRARLGVATEVMPKTLRDLGITKDLSARSQKLAAVTEGEFEEAVSAAKAIAGEVTAASIIEHRERSARSREVMEAGADDEVMVLPGRMKSEGESVNALFDALETLSDFPIPAHAVFGVVVEYQRYRITERLDESIEFLTALRAHWETR